MKRYLMLGVIALALGCSGDDGGDASSVDANNAAVVDSTELAANEVMFKVPGMTWPTSCTAAVKGALAGLPGVASVEIDFPGRTATCTIEGDKFNSEDALKALEEASFPATMVRPTI